MPCTGAKMWLVQRLAMRRHVNARKSSWPACFGGNKPTKRLRLSGGGAGRSRREHYRQMRLISIPLQTVVLDKCSGRAAWQSRATYHFLGGCSKRGLCVSNTSYYSIAPSSCRRTFHNILTFAKMVSSPQISETTPAFQNSARPASHHSRASHQGHHSHHSQANSVKLQRSTSRCKTGCRQVILFRRPRPQRHTLRHHRLVCHRHLLRRACQAGRHAKPGVAISLSIL